MSIPTVTESTIHEHTAEGSFERGKQYLEDGAVQTIEQVDEHTVKARVQGSDVHPYLVTIRFDESRVTDVRCTCPYHGGSWCKHVVAVLLKTSRNEAVPKAESVAVADLVEDLDRDTLIDLLESLAEANPDLVDKIETERARLTADD